MSEQEELALIARGMALRTGKTVSDPYIWAAALGVYAASGRLYDVAAAGFGSVRIFFERHKVAQPPYAFEMSESMPPELRGLVPPES